MLWSTLFWRGAFERMVKTAAQTLLAVIGVGSLGVADVDWVGALSIAAVATLASLLTSIGNADFTAGQTPVVIEHDRATTVVNVAPAGRTVDLTGPEEYRND